IIRGITSYPDREAEAYPYSIIVTDPRPSFEEGQSKVYGFSVGDTIPVIEIPLADADVIVFDFGAVYNQFYANTRFFGETVDYEQLPVRFETYSPDDQQRIRAQMQAVSKIYRGKLMQFSRINFSYSVIRNELILYLQENKNRLRISEQHVSMKTG